MYTPNNNPDEQRGLDPELKSFLRFWVSSANAGGKPDDKVSLRVLLDTDNNKRTYGVLNTSEMLQVERHIKKITKSVASWEGGLDSIVTAATVAMMDEWGVVSANTLNQLRVVMENALYRYESGDLIQKLSEGKYIESAYEQLEKDQGRDKRFWLKYYQLKLHEKAAELIQNYTQAFCLIDQPAIVRKQFYVGQALKALQAGEADAVFMDDQGVIDVNTKLQVHFFLLHAHEGLHEALKKTLFDEIIIESLELRSMIQGVILPEQIKNPHHSHTSEDGVEPKERPEGDGWLNINWRGDGAA